MDRGWAADLARTEEAEEAEVSASLGEQETVVMPPTEYAAASVANVEVILYAGRRILPESGDYRQLLDSP